jgi:hypothetical protein
MGSGHLEHEFSAFLPKASQLLLTSDWSLRLLSKLAIRQKNEKRSQTYKRHSYVFVEPSLVHLEQRPSLAKPSLGLPR